ncbi:hypothetical protein CK203_087459 [Vitis vinifera]|uniref:Uncharacterized protein n=1 Tax=Vitis vinifera TaxID=29760 RepID=A0A438ENJ3_VITVI|nr:hypothetical protein CK203_087459 [Vitis vinifera]
MQSKRLHGELLPIWILPPMGSFKLNFDECALGNLAQLAIASVIRDHSHTVLAAFPKPADERASTPRQGFWLLFREFTISQGPWKYAGWLHQILDAASNLGCAFSSSPHFANHAAGGGNRFHIQNCATFSSYLNLIKWFSPCEGTKQDSHQDYMDRAEKARRARLSTSSSSDKNDI